MSGGVDIPVKRIALFTGNYNHIMDGVSITLNRLVAYLERTGSQVLVFGPTIDEPAFEHSGTLVPVPSIPMPGRDEYRISLRLPGPVRDRLAAFNPDIVHIATPDVLGLKARAYAIENEKPIVASYHTHFSSYLKYYHMSVLETAMWSYLRWFYSECEHIYVPTSSMADVLREHGIEEGLEIWPRGVYIDRFHPDHRSLQWRRDHGITDEEVVVAFVSRLVLEKGPDVYARTVQTLRDEGLPVRGLIVGEGPAREMIEQHLPGAVFAGHLTGADLSAAYASSDIFLFPSETETFGNVTLEAMASGLPTVCADATGSSSLVHDGETGYLVPPGDDASFARQTRALVEDTELRGRLGRRARDVATRYSWPVILGRIDDYYNRLLSEVRAEKQQEERPAVTGRT